MTSPSDLPHKSDDDKTMTRQVGAVTAATFLSRLLGYARDALIAQAFGGRQLTDAFYAAFRLSNLLRRILGEGPLTSAFVPVFSEHLTSNDRKGAQEFFQTIFTALAALLLVLVALGVFFAPFFTQLMAWGFKSVNPEKFDLTVHLTRLMFPFLFFICLSAISAGALNALGYFFVPALAPAMLSIAEIGFVLLLARTFKNPLEGLAVSAVIGGALHFLLLVPAMKKEGIQPKWRWNPKHPDILRIVMLILPALWGLSVDQINAYVDTICASFLMDGSVTALYNSNRLMQFPLALFGIASSTAALPNLSLCVSRGDWESYKRTLNYTLRMVFYTILPATVGLIVLGVPIVQLLFEHGKFTHSETLLTNAALGSFALGLPAFTAVEVIVNGFYAMKDTKSPVRVATLCLLINMAGNISLMRFGVRGLAFSTSVASYVNGGVLIWMMRKKIGRLGGRRFLKTLAQSSGAAIVMGVVSATLMNISHGAMLWRVPMAVASGGLVYMFLTRLMGMEEYGHVHELIFSRVRGHSVQPAQPEEE